MKTKLVVWGENEAKEKVLLSLELLPEENEVVIKSFAEEEATQEFYNSLMNDWRRGKEIPIPAKHKEYKRTLTMTDSILPDELKVMRTDLITRAQTEWHFVVLSHKMSKSFKSELEDMEDKLERITEYKQQYWEELKGFWDKVQGQMKEKNLFWDHYHELKGRTNTLFDKLKKYRKKKDEEFRSKSAEVKAEFTETLDDIEAKVKKGLGLKPIFEQLKKEQRKMKDADLTRGDRNSIWKRLDGLFKEVKEKRFGDKGSSSSPLKRVENRYNGLLNAMNRMKSSIDRDKKDLHYETKRMQNSDNQLENQLRQAKLAMIEERIRSKSEKYDDMQKTKSMLEDKIEKEQKREEERKRKAELKKAKEAEKQKLKEEIQKKIQTTQPENTEDFEKLKKAAEKIKESQKKKSRKSRAKNPQKKDLLVATISSGLGILEEE